MNRLLTYAGVLLVIIGLATWWFSPRQVIKRRTLSLLETLTMDAGTGRLARQRGMYSLNSVLAPEVALHSPSIPEANGVFARSDLESAYSWLSQHARQTRFQHQRFDSVSVAGGEGTVVFTLDALVELATHRPADGSYDVTFRWRQDDHHKWRLTSATWIER